MVNFSGDKEGEKVALDGKFLGDKATQRVALDNGFLLGGSGAWWRAKGRRRRQW